MKKIIAILVAALAVTFAASAQPRAVGLRVGYGVDASYQHTLAGENFLEVDLGLTGFRFLDIHASYNFIFASPTWTTGEWNLYVGPSVGLVGFDGGAQLGLGGLVGIEYTFNFPLQLSFDVRPEARIGSNGGFACYPTLGIRYRF